jgi:hypothetical protein
MPAEEMMNMAPLGPKAFTTMYVAFGDAWAEIQASCGDRATEEMRTRLAWTLLRLITEESNDPSSLKKMALELMTSSSSDPGTIFFV